MPLVRPLALKMNDGQQEDSFVAAGEIFVTKKYILGFMAAFGGLYSDDTTFCISTDRLIFPQIL